MKQISLFESDKKNQPSSLRGPSSKKTNILSVFEDCHNYIYANEGVLKEKAFREITRILFIKIYCEKKPIFDNFHITQQEYQNIFSNIPCKNFETRIKKLYKTVSKNSSLNIWNESSLLSLKTLAYIVNKLQFVVLKNNPGDTMGQAFQTFMHSHQRGERGEFFTPAPVVELAVQMIEPRYNEKLIDPACGSGGFLLNAIRYVEQQTSGKKTTYYVKNNVYGMEFNPDVALAAKLLMEIEGGCESNIICGNSLNIQQHDGMYDIVLTNPPFGRRGKVEDTNILSQYDLGKKWLCLNNRWRIQKSILRGQSPEILFLEKCLSLLKPNGRIVTVIPDGLLQNPSLSFVRHWLKSRAGIPLLW